MTAGCARLKTESQPCQPLSPIFCNTRSSCNKFSKHSGGVPVCWHCFVSTGGVCAPCPGVLSWHWPGPGPVPAGCVTTHRGHANPRQCHNKHTWQPLTLGRDPGLLSPCWWHKALWQPTCTECQPCTDPWPGHVSSPCWG